MSVLWTPVDDQALQIRQFAEYVSTKAGVNCSSFADLHRWSIDQPDAFWNLCAEWFDLPWREMPQGVRLLSQPEEGDPDRMLGWTWFPGGRLNFAEMVVKAWSHRLQDTAVVTIDEGGVRREPWTGQQLLAAVHLWADTLRGWGVGPGDRVCAVLTFGIESIVLFLASQVVGAIWSSCSPDFGEQAIIDRFEQIAPAVFFWTPVYQYKGKSIDRSATFEILRSKLSSVRHWQTFCDSPLPDLLEGPGCRVSSRLAPSHALLKIAPENWNFEPRAFSDPMIILFSSGTTGKPKCIVHSLGGTLLQHLKEHAFHCDLKPGERLFFFTTCGWMMWNWTLSALALGVTILTYDGAPTFPHPDVLVDVLQREKADVIGVSPRLIAAMDMKVRLTAGPRLVLSTGAPLLDEQFDEIQQIFGRGVQVASISGGTDIVSCFVLGNPWSNVYRGQIQGPGLGMAVEVWNAEGEPVVAADVAGELVCVKPFVSMPIGFWGDRDNQKFRDAYFNYFKNRSVWRHGDLIARTEEGGFRISGRSDATLNPGGVRIGTAELYAVVEQIEGIADCLAFGLRSDGDEEIALVLVPTMPSVARDHLILNIKSKVREQLSPRHVPKHFFFASGIPYTRSGKKVEIALRRIFAGQNVEQVDALANPEVLGELKAIAQAFKGGKP